MQINKVITPQVISLLYGISDEEEISQTTDFILGTITETQKNLARNFLVEKGVNQDDVENFFNNDELENEQINELLESEEMAKLYVDGYNSVVDLIYSEQLKTMDEESKQKLNKLLELEEQSKLSDIQSIDTYTEAVKIIEELKNSGQVTQEQIDEALGKAYDEVFVDNNAQEPAQADTQNEEQPTSNDESTTPPETPQPESPPDDQ